MKPRLKDGQPQLRDGQPLRDLTARMTSQAIAKNRLVETNATAKKDRAFYAVHCAYSCETCDIDWCYDSYPICRTLKKKGWCNNENQGWMEFYCPESCGVDCDAV